MSVRSAIAPAFRRHVVQDHATMVHGIVAEEAHAWPRETVFAVHPALRALTLRVILRTIFGEEDTPLRALHENLLEMLAVTTSLVLQEPRVRYLPGWHRTWGRFVRRREEVDELIAALVRGRRRRSADGSAGTGAGDMLDMLLAMRRPDGSALSERELRDQLVSTIIAGHETTASSLAWAFQLLAHDTRVQERLAREIERDEGQEYLTATVHEVLRHSPVFLFAVPRAVVQPIEIGGWTYRPPAHLLACTYLMQRDPTLHPDPEAFRPERFLEAPPSPRTWLPLGGSRAPALHGPAPRDGRDAGRAARCAGRARPGTGRTPGAPGLAQRDGRAPQRLAGDPASALAHRARPARESARTRYGVVARAGFDARCRSAGAHRDGLSVPIGTFLFQSERFCLDLALFWACALPKPSRS